MQPHFASFDAGIYLAAFVATVFAIYAMMTDDRGAP